MAYKGDEKKIASKIKEIEHIIKNGRSIAIDPASVNMGYAIIENGEIVKSGVFTAPKNASIGNRLAIIKTKIEREGPFDACFIEFVRGGRMGHIYLVWSAGVAAAAANAIHTHEIRISMWKKLAELDESYTKSDENDAIKIAEVVLDCIKDEHEQASTKKSTRRR